MPGSLFAPWSSMPEKNTKTRRGSRWLQTITTVAGLALLSGAAALAAPRDQVAPLSPAASATDQAVDSPRKTPSVYVDSLAADGGGTNSPAPVAIPINPGGLTDEQIGTAITDAANWLYGQFDPKTHAIRPTTNDAKKDATWAGGEDALAVYALMQASLAMHSTDARFDLKGKDMLDKVDAMCKFNLDAGHPQTYAHSLRATALALLYDNLPEVGEQSAKVRKAIRPVLAADAMYCLLACDGGAYSYRMPKNAPNNMAQLLNYYRGLRVMPNPVNDWDNSNSQYGLLGVWSAADSDAGIEIPAPYWFLVDHHWSTCQHPNGQWSYNRGGKDGSLSMTCAGLASMLVTHDWVSPAIMVGNVDREPFSPPVAKGLQWFETGDNAVGGQANEGYTLYGVERVGLASGFKMFGTHDWYRELADRAISSQKGGSWNGGHGAVVNTSYHLLFLARGRHPIIMNKLRFKGFWANRPHDVGNLARYAGKMLERQLNWQVINIDNDASSWMDAPILTLSSQTPPKLTKEEIDKIRQFVYYGGILYTQADGDSPAFNKFAEQLAKDLFDAELQKVPDTSPIYTSDTVNVIKPPIPLRMVTNGSRMLMIHSDRDISRWWQQRDAKLHKREFQLGLNMFVYGAGKGVPKNRLNSNYIPPVTSAPLATIKVARLQYPGGWNPEPGAWERYPNWFQHQTSYKLDVKTIDLTSLKPGDAELAVLTGNAPQNFNATSAAALKAYVEAGGVVLIDMTGGNGQFDQSAQKLLQEAFPGAAVQQVAMKDPLLQPTFPGMADLSSRSMRQTGINLIGRGSQLSRISAGKGQVLFTRLDITSGLLNSEIVSIIGYSPAYAQQLVQNVLFWANNSQGRQPAPANVSPKPVP